MLPRSLRCVLRRQQHFGRDDIFARLREAGVGLGLRGEEKDNVEAQRAQRWRGEDKSEARAIHRTENVRWVEFLTSLGMTWSVHWSGVRLVQVRWG
jgi:hypothetical protein